jgi:nucleolin
VKKDSDDDNDSSEKPKKQEKPEKKKIIKKADSDDSDDDESEIKAKPKKQTTEKKETKIEKKDSDDDDDDSEESNKKPIKPKEQKKQKEESDDDEDDSSEKKEKENKVEKKKKESESDSDDDEEEKPRAKETAKKEEDSDEKEEEEKEKDDNKEEELPPNAYEELFVRNIGFNTTQEELADAFQKYGDVEESKICTDKQTGKSKGFGFLKFYEKKSAVAAMNDADNIVVGGRNLQIRYSNDKSGPIRGGGNGNNNSGKKGPSTEFGIFVGNISYKCTENDLKKFFKDCGKVVDVRLAKKPDGKLKGFAHVDFENKEAVDKAVQKNGEELQGRALKIDKSTGGKGGAGSGNRGGQGGRGGRGREPADPLAKARRSGGIIAPTENKVTTYDDSSDDE